MSRALRAKGKSKTEFELARKDTLDYITNKETDKNVLFCRAVLLTLLLVFFLNTKLKFCFKFFQCVKNERNLSMLR
jgi:hypothetical protein